MKIRQIGLFGAGLHFAARHLSPPQSSRTRIAPVADLSTLRFLIAKHREVLDVDVTGSDR
jgi:hypothetical protein